jgi:NAD(P)-dependent dehydrogenase (short-subunit alcohol dehydrogenase family)
MKDFKGKVAVITGAGTGMGRELARQLVAEGCHVAICDFIVENMNETQRLCEAEAQPGTRITTFECDVSDEDQIIAFRDSVMKAHDTEHINLLFNNAGVSGAGSFVLGDRKIWDRVFAIDWFGVYYSTRAFMPMLLASTEGHIINTSSVNGFWACLGPQTEHTAYSSAKFAVKGFTEALQVDLRLNAPHVKASLVMPGHIGTSIGMNYRKILGDPEIDDIPASDLAALREVWEQAGLLTEKIEDEQIREMLRHAGEDFRDNAPVSSAEGAKIILDGVRNGQWRILVGEDAKALDQLSRTYPEELYDPELYERIADSGGLGSMFSQGATEDEVK